MHAEAEAPQMSNEAAASSLGYRAHRGATSAPPSRGPHVLQREADLFLLRVEVIAPLPSTIVAYGGLR